MVEVDTLRCGLWFAIPRLVSGDVLSVACALQMAWLHAFDEDRKLTPPPAGIVRLAAQPL